MKDRLDGLGMHFRWITPLLLSVTIYLLQQMFHDFKELQKDVTTLQVDVATIKTYLRNDLPR